jgi:hypothetical protein
MPAVNRSLRTSTPSSAATAGLTYVIRLERTGPPSATSAKKSTKAIVVQTRASVAIDAITRPDGTEPGSCTSTIGR